MTLQQRDAGRLASRWRKLRAATVSCTWTSPRKTVRSSSPRQDASRGPQRLRQPPTRSALPPRPAAAASGDGPDRALPRTCSAPATRSRTFSDDGPRRIFFNPGRVGDHAKQFLVYGWTSFWPSQTSPPPTGSSTNLPLNGGLNPFFGTSCAAPHAGAIATLLLSYKAGLTPAQVGAGLRGGTVQITNPGPGDRDSGAGIPAGHERAPDGQTRRLRSSRSRPRTAPPGRWSPSRASTCARRSRRRSTARRPLSRW